MNLFIDTNIFLNFYHYSDEDLNRLNDLVSLIEARTIRLYLTQQIIDEFNRNRESKINDAIKRLKSSSSDLGLPRLCDGYEEKEKIQKSLNDIKTLKTELIKKIREQTINRTLPADKLIKRVFDLSNAGILTDTLIIKAKNRFDRGNPPGKDNSNGDALNWTYLLETATYGEDLFFISGDKDFASPLDEEEFSLFLLDEWHTNKNSKVIYYSSLNSFFKAQRPAVEITDEDIKDGKIKALSESHSFYEARKILSELQEIGDFSTKQINDIARASIGTYQVYGAHTYSPEKVGHIISELIKGHEHDIEYDVYCELCRKMNIEPIVRLEDPPLEVPF